MRCNSGTRSKRLKLYNTAVVNLLGLSVGIGMTLFAGLVSSAADNTAKNTSVHSGLASKSLLLEAAKAGDRLVVVGERGHVLYSDDHGAGWQQAEVPTLQMITSVSFPGADHGWAVGHDGNILVTNDGGEHWTLQHDGLAVEAMRLEADIARTRLKIERLKQQLKDVGDNDTELNSELEESQFDLEDLLADTESVVADPLLDVWFMDRDHGFAVGAFGKFLRTDDGGKHWQDWGDHLSNIDELHLNAVTGNAAGTLFVVGEAGSVWRSSDAGLNWEALETPYEGSYFGALIARNGADLYVHGLRGHIFHSADQGDTWQQVSSQVEQTITGSTELSSGRIIFVGAGGVLVVGDTSNNAFTATVNSNRLDLSAVTETASGAVVLLGRGGLQLVQLNSTRLSLANN